MMSSGVGDFLDELESIQTKSFRTNPYVEIVEQPAEKSLRFRYSSEGKWAGSIRGVKYTPLHKSYPTIKVIGYRGKTSVVVSCVLEDPDKTGKFKQHPHKLVGKDGCENGVCRLAIPEETMSITFPNLGIHCVTKKEIEESLKLRKRMKIDPFNGEFFHSSRIVPKHLKTLRLCFQVYLEVNGNKIPLDPVVSNPITNKKNHGHLVIVKLSQCVSPATGSNHDIMMFCEKIEIDDIQIRFYENKKNALVWEDIGLFEANDVHKEFGISFKAPRYKDVDITEPVEVFIQLVRPSDGVCSTGIPFHYLPISTNPCRIGIKRARGNELLEELKVYQEKSNLLSTNNMQINDSFAPQFSQNIPSSTQMSRSPNNVLEVTPRSLPRFETWHLPPTTKVQVQMQNNTAFETSPRPLRSFPGTWGSIDQSNGFLNKKFDSSSNSSNIELSQLNLIDSNIEEEPKILNLDLLEPNSLPKTKVSHRNLIDLEIEDESNILNRNLLAPNSFTESPFNNFSISNCNVINNIIPQGELPRDDNLTWLLDENFGYMFNRKSNNAISQNHEYTEF